jgi:hypothetical protein
LSSHSRTMAWGNWGVELKISSPIRDTSCPMTFPSNRRVFALHAQGPGFQSQHHQNNTKKPRRPEANLYLMRFLIPGYLPHVSTVRDFFANWILPLSGICGSQMLPGRRESKLAAHVKGPSPRRLCPGHSCKEWCPTTLLLWAQAISWPQSNRTPPLSLLW